MAEVIDFPDVGKVKDVKDAAKWMQTCRSAVINAIPDDAPQGLAILAGLSFFVEAANQFAEDEDELMHMVDSAVELAKLMTNQCTCDETQH